MHDNPLGIGKHAIRNDRDDTDEESAQFVPRPSTIDSNDVSGYQTGHENRRSNIEQQPPGYVSGYNSGYSSG